MDKPTFEQVVSEHGAWIRKTLSRLGVAPRDMDDVQQDVLYAVARGLPAFDPSRAEEPARALVSWLLSICERQVANHFRARHRRREQLQETGELDGHDSGAPTPEALLLTRERDARLYEVLERVEPGRRAVIVAHALGGTAMSDVAHTLRIPVNTAWNRLRLAREDVRAAWSRPERKKPSARPSWNAARPAVAPAAPNRRKFR